MRLRPVDAAADFTKVQMHRPTAADKEAGMKLAKSGRRQLRLLAEQDTAVLGVWSQLESRVVPPYEHWIAAFNRKVAALLVAGAHPARLAKTRAGPIKYV